MAVNGVRVEWDGMRSVTAASLNSGAWEAVGTAFEVQPRLIKFINNTDADITVSFVGIDGTEIDFFPRKSQCIYDLSSNKSNQSGYLGLAEGKLFYAKQSAAITNSENFYIVALWAAGAGE
jgi:hypothetical protein